MYSRERARQIVTKSGEREKESANHISCFSFAAFFIRLTLSLLTAKKWNCVVWPGVGEVEARA